MRNAKDELIKQLDKIDISVKCAHIFRGRLAIKLKVGYSGAEFDQFMDQLDFEYNAGFGYQELYGLVWLNDESWLEREEYDGAECWECRSTPEIPNNLF